ncbi:MAG: glycosyl hydrolase 53 family protein [Bacteroidia bacterium]|nr:glycosyl hydrolase 53 family protein [Bacteroidia bacterium]
MRLIRFIPLILSLITLGCKPVTDDNTNGRVFYTDDQFSMGADLSYVNQIIDHGGIYKDSGIIQDPYAIFRKYGANTVRFRLWHNPQWTRTVYTPPLTNMYNDFYDVKRGILAAKAQGMAVCLDFHYSDSWADPAKQVPPAAWAGLTVSVLHDSIYNYTLKTLDRLEEAGAMPEYVQAGNEINPGFVLPKGNRWDNTSDFVYLLNGAIKAIRDASVSSSIKPKIIIHIAQPENVYAWFDGLAAKGLTDYDIIGFSYYYIWSGITLNNISNYVSLLKSSFHKDVMIMETIYPWTTQNADNYGNIVDPGKLTPDYPATEKGQYDYLHALTAEIIKGGGKGIFTWEPAWITSSAKDLWGTGSSWDCNTFFDFNGNTLKGIQFMSDKYTFNE